MSTPKNQNETEMQIRNFDPEGGSSNISGGVFQKTYNMKGAICMYIIMPITLIVPIVFQIYFWADGKKETAMNSAYMSFATGFCFLLFVGLVCYGPYKVTLYVDKSSDSIRAVYHLLGGRSIEQHAKVSQVEKIDLKPIRTQHGIVGYQIQIIFKDESPMIKLNIDKEAFTMGSEQKALEDCNELSRLILGKDAVDNVPGPCSCERSAKTMVCCSGWQIKLAITVIIILVIIGASFGISLALKNDEPDDD